MKKTYKDWHNLIKRNSNSFDHADAAAPEMVIPAGGFTVEGNPAFVATHNLRFLTFYFTLNGGSYTSIAPAALNAGLQNELPFFVYGNNDFASGFKKIKGQFNINSNWTYGRPGIWGKDDFNEFGFDATVTGSLQTGDLLIPFTSALPGAGTTTLALKVVRCPEIGYGTLLSQLNSDRFAINAIRFVLSDPVNDLNQYSHQIQFQELSIFGKFDSDQLTPNDFKIPSQFQNGIVDIPIGGKWGEINKHKCFGFFTDFDNDPLSWTVFSPRVQKLV